MVVAYADAGAAGATATSGAALTAACPATVNAGDILIAYVEHRTTNTAPTTPADWTPLFGPANVGTTVTARHWVYGKVADGTEDGASIDFGTAGGTAVRSARISRFTGRVSGTIADCVPAGSFTSIPHATDPAAPTVTTTMAGSLAVGLSCQSDDNVLEVYAGQTGGTWALQWTHVSALGLQLAMALNTCTPTADPGTVTGGGMTVVNDPAGTIGFEIRPSGVPATGSLSETQDNQTLAASGGHVPVRSFDGADDRIVCSPGSVLTQAVAANRTFVALVKSGTNDQWGSFICLNASTDHGAAFALDIGNQLALRIDGGSGYVTSSTIALTTALGWCLIAVNKASGTATPRFHLYRFDTQAWSHEAGSGTVGDGSLGATADIEIAALSNGGDTFQGYIAAAAIFPSSMSDAAIEALAPGLQEWVDGNPSALWPLTQAAVTTAVEDITDNGADQSSRVGTTVVTGDSPPGFDWTLSSGSTGTLSETQANQTLAASGHITHSGTLAETQANQTLAASGTSGQAITGSLAETQADQTLAASGHIIHSGSLSETQANQTLAASGTVTVTGSLAETQASQTLTAAGLAGAIGGLSEVQANQTLAASGQLGASGSLAEAQANQTLAATGLTGEFVTGTLSETQANQTLAASGTNTVTGALAETQANQTLAASGTALLPIVGSLSETQASQTLVASGATDTVGALAETQASHVLVASGTVVSGGPPVQPVDIRPRRNVLRTWALPASTWRDTR